MTSYRMGELMRRELFDMIGTRNPRTLSPECIGFWFTWARAAIRMMGGWKVGGR